MKLEKRLIKSWNELRRLTNLHLEPTERLVVRFYQEYHHFERLNQRYKKQKGMEFNPVREYQLY